MTLNLTQWDEATSHQRFDWLRAGATLRSDDLEALKDRKHKTFLELILLAHSEA